MVNLFVLDTCAIISYYNSVFNEPATISAKSLRFISKAFSLTDVKAIVPSIVFIELYQLYFREKEMANRIKYEVFLPIKECPNFEIRGFDKDSLLKFIMLNDMDDNDRFDNHDKQILCSAMVMNCPLMTSDSKIIRYNNKRKVIPSILD